MTLPTPFIHLDSKLSMHLPEDWDFYMCHIDDKIASIYLNLALAECMPVPDQKYVMYVQFQMIHPREDGLSSDQDFDQLIALEDSLVDGLEQQINAIYVGRVTSNGKRDFFFYLSHIENIEAIVRDLMQDFGVDQSRFGIRKDEQGELYLNYLFPSAATLKDMMDRRENEEVGDPDRWN